MKLIPQTEFSQEFGTLKAALPIASQNTLTAVRRELNRLLIRMQSVIVGDKLHGGVLHWLTGRLARSVHHEVLDMGDAIEGRIYAGKEAPYGRVHEFGGTFTVAAHLRIITQAFGVELSQPWPVFVREHDATYPERSFLRSTVGENRMAFEEAIRQAVRSSV